MFVSDIIIAIFAIIIITALLIAHQNKIEAWQKETRGKSLSWTNHKRVNRN